MKIQPFVVGMYIRYCQQTFVVGMYIQYCQQTFVVGMYIRYCQQTFVVGMYIRYCQQTFVVGMYIRYCQQTFAKKSQLMEHHCLNKHHNTFTCGVCQKRFTRKDYIDRHEKKHDSFFPCNECGLLYRRKDNLYPHLKEKHQSGAGLQNQPVDINHPDQYYTITKEKGQKMPRFNTESNEYRVTFNELNIQSVPDILNCPDLDFPIRLPCMQMNQLTIELLLAEIERVIQSNEQFVLDHCVQLNITHVSLPKGGTRKRCDYVDTERFLKDKRCTPRFFRM
jgi:hypothetical protein